MKEVIYLSDTQVKNDGKSLIFGVAIDQVGGRVNLTFPRAGEMG